MLKKLTWFSAMVGVLACLTAATAAKAQQEFPPPQGKGRVVVLASGTSGPAHYTTIAREIAELGYDVVLFDGNQMAGTTGDGVKTDIMEAQQMPHALPGKVALVGFSMGGGMYLYYATQWPDMVAGAVIFCPVNSFIHDVPGFASRLKVPVLMFAAAKDHNCCLAELDNALAAASTAADKTFKLVVYADADHDFVKGEDRYNPKDYSDAFKRMADTLKEFLGSPLETH
ncbi:MAG TPA: dienelactone hydrolase family protein [Candidatus Acidoferrum sp.]|nr:dienelactone hydrolase family protein [Candidatus Acidoferrum sp.]